MKVGATSSRDVDDKKPLISLSDSKVTHSVSMVAPRRVKRVGERSHDRDYYYSQWLYLKQKVKDYVFLNSSLCDEVINVEEKLAQVKEERRYLLQKLLHYHSIYEGTNSAQVSDFQMQLPAQKHSKSPSRSTAENLPETGVRKSDHKNKISLLASTGNLKRKQQSTNTSDMLQGKLKKTKIVSHRKTIPPLQLDNLGRPVFPMLLGDLTLHSVGEIVPDHKAFCFHDCIYPVGFCSTRVFASMSNPLETCLYTCMISDNGDAPEFEIASEDSSRTFRALSADACHTQLLQAIKNTLGADIFPVSAQGTDFFGLTNPIVQNLIQSCPGSKKCPGYKWIRFEINKSELNENVSIGRTDPTVSITAFHKILQETGFIQSSMSDTDCPTTLRTLLAKTSVASSPQPQ